MADKSNDPAAMWQNMIGEMEKGSTPSPIRRWRRRNFPRSSIRSAGSRRARRSSSAISWRISRRHEPAEPAQMVSMAERLCRSKVS